MPLADMGVLKTAQIFGVSGYSGAGTNPSDKNDVKYLTDNIVPYGLVNHIHEREISTQLETNVEFMPHVASFFQGISLTSNAKLMGDKLKTRDDVVKVYEEYFKDEPLIHVVKDDSVTVKTHGTGQHGVTIGGFELKDDRVVIVSVIDNLLKGAATQCLQNMNLALGLNEYEGISNNEE